MPLPPWSQYQEEAAEFFRRLGLRAETNVTLQGVRSAHDIDVVVQFERAGIPHLWVVECKHYSRPVAKDKPLALRAIADEVGADRGFLLCEKGFQRGAREVVDKTNIIVASLAELETAGREELFRVEVANVELRLRAAQRAWRALYPPLTKHSEGSWSGKLPILPRGAWPPGGSLALTGRIAEAEHAVQRARFDEFPVLLAEPESDRPQRIHRELFIPAVSRLLDCIDAAIASASRPAD